MKSGIRATETHCRKGKATSRWGSGKALEDEYDFDSQRQWKGYAPRKYGIKRGLKMRNVHI